MNKVQLDQLHDWVDEYEQHVLNHHGSPPANVSWANDTINRLIGQRDACVKRHPVQGLWDWASTWPEADAELSPNRFQRLHVALQWLDGYLVRHSAAVHPTHRGILILGQKWWQEVVSEEPGARRRVEPQSQSRFFHIRAIKSSELVANGAIEDAFGGVMSEQELRIGLCSLSGAAKTFFAGTSRMGPQKYGFRANIIECIGESHAASRRTAYLAELIACTQWAMEHRMHVLCLPELSVCPQGRQAIWETIESAGDRGCLCMVIPGSYHVHSADDGVPAWHNEAPVWLVHGNQMILQRSYRKMHPYELSCASCGSGMGFGSITVKAAEEGCNALGEDIQAGEAMFFGTPIGLICVLVCRDANADLPSFVRCVEVADHVIVLSMNHRCDETFRRAARVARNAYAAMYYVNARQVVEGGNATELAIADVPVERGDCIPHYFYESGDREPPQGIISIAAAIKSSTIRLAVQPRSASGMSAKFRMPQMGRIGVHVDIRGVERSPLLRSGK